MDKTKTKELLNEVLERFPIQGLHTPWLIPCDQGDFLGQSNNLYLKEYEKFDIFCSTNKIKKIPRILFYQQDHFGIFLFLEGIDDAAEIKTNNPEIEIKVIHQSSLGMLVKAYVYPFKQLGLVEFEIQVQGISANLFISWDLNWNIENHAINRASGWIANKILPHKPIVINIFRNEHIIKKIENNNSRADVKDALGFQSLFCGFDETLEVTSTGLQLQKLAIDDSNIYLSSEPVIYIDPKYSKIFTQKIKRIFKNQQSSNLIEQNFLERVASSFSPLIFENYLKNIGQNLILQIPNTRIDKNLTIIIPVYDGYETTVSCIESTVNSKNKSKLQIIIGFDCGPNKKILDYLYGIQNKFDNVKLIVNEENLGFVKNVNNLVKHKIYNDFVLLNADAIVFDGFFDRIHDALNRDRTYASLTPLSNHATIYTYIPSSSSIDYAKKIDAKLAISGQAIVPTPVGHGFCMLINGDIYRRIGMFDEKWGKGYGEEVDWSLKAQKNTGLRNGGFLGGLVYHKGSVSFGVDQMIERVNASSKMIEELYPGFSEDVGVYSLEGSLNQGKITLDKYIAPSASKKTHVFVTHPFGGGVDVYIKSKFPKCESYLVFSMIGDENIGFYWKVEGSEISERYFKLSDIDLLSNWIEGWSILSVSVEHLGLASPIELARLLKIFRKEYSVMLHDFSWICPRINLLDHSGRFCGVRSSEECETCVSKSPIQSSGDVMFSKINFVSDLRKKSLNILQDASKVYAPSVSTRNLYGVAFNDLRVNVKPHHRERIFKQRLPKSKFSKTVCVLGGISRPKGMTVYKELADFMEKNAPEFKIVFI